MMREHPNQERLAYRPTISRHAEPQVSPQEWSCGCVTGVYVTDRDRRDRPFEMRLHSFCGKPTCVFYKHFMAHGIRDLAVALVDNSCGGGGHTMEFCWDPASHEDQYDEMEAFLKGEEW